MKRALTLVVAMLAAATASAADSFDAGLAKARANEETAEWRTYSGPFLQKLGPILQGAMQRCFPAIEREAPNAFTIVFAVRADGSLAQLMARPESKRTACVLEEIEDARVPAPPRPDWWAFLELQVTP